MGRYHNKGKYSDIADIATVAMPWELKDLQITILQLVDYVIKCLLPLQIIRVLIINHR